MNNNCSCNDSIQIEKKCFNCKTKCQVEATKQEKFDSCKVHKLLKMDGWNLYLCPTCKDDGYVIEWVFGSGGPMGTRPMAVKKDIN